MPTMFSVAEGRYLEEQHKYLESQQPRHVESKLQQQ